MMKTPQFPGTVQKLSDCTERELPQLWRNPRLTRHGAHMLDKFYVKWPICQTHKLRFEFGHASETLMAYILRWASLQREATFHIQQLRTTDLLQEAASLALLPLHEAGQQGWSFVHSSTSIT